MCRMLRVLSFARQNEGVLARLIFSYDPSSLGIVLCLMRMFRMGETVWDYTAE